VKNVNAAIRTELQATQTFKAESESVVVRLREEVQTLEHANSATTAKLSRARLDTDRLKAALLLANAKVDAAQGEAASWKKHVLLHKQQSIAQISPRDEIEFKAARPFSVAVGSESDSTISSTGSQRAIGRGLPLSPEITPSRATTVVISTVSDVWQSFRVSNR
jgi:chromosome segregation ATPase